MKGVRALHLYTSEHSQVARWIDVLVASLDQACRAESPLVLEIRRQTVELGGEVLYDSADERETLVERLHADGIRSLHFHSGLDHDAARRLLGTLAPYCYAERAPLQPASDRLHWEPFKGLTFHVQNKSAGRFAVDALTSRERLLMDSLATRDRGAFEPVGPDAMTGVWDGSGGIVDWPVVVPADRATAMDEEIETANSRRAPAFRVGMLLRSAISDWPTGS